MFLILLLAAVLGGTALTLVYDETATLVARLAAGAALGLALLSLLELLLTALLDQGATSLGGACLLVASPVLLARGPRGRLLRFERPHAVELAGFVLMAALLAAVYDRAYIQAPDGIATGNDNNLGDLPFHIAVVASFAYAGNLPPEHPELSGAPLTYPVAADYGVAQLVRGGASLHGAFYVHNLILAWAALVLLHRFARRLTGDHLAALLAPPLLFLSGGLGFLYLLREAWGVGGPGLLALLRHLPHEYTLTRGGELRFGNALTTLLTTQRSLLLGLPLSLLVMTLWWDAQEEADEPRRARLMAAAGCVAGLLPLAHTHSLAVLLSMGALLAPLSGRWRAWLGFFGPALALALPQLAWMAKGSAMQGSRFLAWLPGWDSGGRNLLLFWLLNAGLFLPLAALAAFRVPAALRRFTLPFWLLFLVPNLLRLSPWMWDNIKFMFFWYLASTPLVAWLVARCWRRGWAGRAAAPALVLGLTLSGGLDVFRLLSRPVQLVIFDRQAIAFAHELRSRTPPRALILAAPSYDSPVFLTGRRTLLGYRGHIWSQGLDAGSRDEEIARIYSGAPDAQRLLDLYQIDYVQVGPRERALYPLDQGFLARFPTVSSVGPFALLRAR